MSVLPRRAGRTMTVAALRRGAASVMGADLRSARGTLLGRLDLDLLDGLLLLGVQADGDGEDAVVVGRLDVVLVDVGWQRQAAGERAVPELRPVLALGPVVPLGVDRQVAGADRYLDILLRVDPGQFRPDHVVVTVEVILDPDRLGQVGAQRHERLLEPLNQVREHRPRVLAQQSAHFICLPSVMRYFHVNRITAGSGNGRARRHRTGRPSSGPRPLAWRRRAACAGYGALAPRKGRPAMETAPRGGVLRCRWRRPARPAAGGT